MLKRNIQILFRVNDEEHDLLKRNAKKCGLSVARYLRFLIQGYLPKELPPADYYGMIRQLQAIGTDKDVYSAIYQVKYVVTHFELDLENVSEAVFNRPYLRRRHAFSPVTRSLSECPGSPL